MVTKSCRQCGEIKPIAQYRPYYGGRKGTYTTCKLCEKINSREKYLRSKVELTSDESDELDKIHLLWDAQTKAGLRPPRSNRSRPASLDAMIEKYQSAAGPQKWLTEPLTREPEYYQEEVYFALREKYRPILYVDKSTMLPVYDDTHLELLNKIADRFDEYEDTYYDKEEQI